MRIAAHLKGHTAIFFALVLVTSSAADAQPSREISLAKHFKQAGYEQIPLRRTAEHHLYLNGKINGRRRSILVDTGWSFTTISTNSACKLSLLPGEGQNTPRAVLIPHLKLGICGFTNEAARVEHSVFDQQVASFDMVLGCDFLRRHFAFIDCDNGRLYVRRDAPDVREKSALEDGFRRRGYAAVPLKLKTPPGMTCAAHINGHPVELLVDTAAVWSVLDWRQLDRLKLKALPTLTRITGVGKTGTRDIALAQPKSFSLETLPIKETGFAVMDLSDWGLAAPEKQLGEIQGILGGPELLANAALIDCHALKLWVRRGARK